MNHPINLLIAIKEIAYKYQNNKYAFESIYYCFKTVFNMKQAEDESLSDYGKRFKNAVDVMKAQSGLIIMKEHVLRLPAFRGASSTRQNDGRGA